MQTTKQLIKPVLLSLSIFSLGACVAHTDVQTAAPHQTMMRNSVHLVRLPHEIKSEEDGTYSISSVTEHGIKGFLSSVGAGYGDVIMLDAPAASPDRIEAIEALLAETGLAYGGMSALGAKPADGSVMLYIERYVVETPNCNYWPEVNSTQEKNNDSSFHGCSSTINLGLMIADPRDLIAGRYSGTSTATAVNALSANAGTRQNNAATTSNGSSAATNAINAANNAASTGN